MASEVHWTPSRSVVSGAVRRNFKAEAGVDSQLVMYPTSERNGSSNGCVALSLSGVSVFVESGVAPGRDLNEVAK